MGTIPAHRALSLGCRRLIHLDESPRGSAFRFKNDGRRRSIIRKGEAPAGSKPEERKYAGSIGWLQHIARGSRLRWMIAVDRHDGVRGIDLDIIIIGVPFDAGVEPAVRAAVLDDPSVESNVNPEPGRLLGRASVRKSRWSRQLREQWIAFLAHSPKVLRPKEKVVERREHAPHARRGLVKSVFAVAHLPVAACATKSSLPGRRPSRA